MSFKKASEVINKKYLNLLPSKSRIKLYPFIKSFFMECISFYLIENKIIFSIQDLELFYKYFKETNKDLEYLENNSLNIIELEAPSIIYKILIPFFDFLKSINRNSIEFSFVESCFFENIEIVFSCDTLKTSYDINGLFLNKVYCISYLKIDNIVLPNFLKINKDYINIYNNLPSSIIKFTDRIKNK